MRRAIVAAFAALIVVAPAFPAHAEPTGFPPRQAAAPAEANARASILYAVADVQPEFDPALIDSRSSSSTIGSTSVDSVIWPSFLVDAFFFLYQFQAPERLALGIAEARYPQGPTTVDATQSNLFLANAGGGGAVPGTLGHAVANAGLRSANGNAAAATLDLPGVLSIKKAVSSSTVGTASGGVASAEQSLHRVVIGPLSFASIEGSASAAANDGVRHADSSLVVIDARVGTTPVTLDADGVRASSASGQDQVDGVLAAAGIQARLVPASRSTDGEAAASSGGVFVDVVRSATDPTGTPRNAHLQFLLGSAIASARIGDSPTFVPPSFGPPVKDCPGCFDLPGFSLAPSFTRRSIVPDTHIVHRTVVEAVAQPRLPATARGAYAALMLAAFGIVLIRPLVRVASRT